MARKKANNPAPAAASDGAAGAARPDHHPERAAAPAAGSDGTVATEVAARLCKSSDEWVRQRTKEGYIKQVARGRYRVVDLFHGIVDYYRDEGRRTSKSASASRVQDARAREIEIRTAKEEHRLIETDEALAVADEIVGTYKSEFAGLPARVTRDIDLRRKIETEVDAISLRVSHRFSERAHALRAGGSAGLADAEDDA